MKLIVGLGNPGKEYNNTRHNIGFITLDKFCLKHNIELGKSKFDAIWNSMEVNGEKIIFIKPQLYMNLSGYVVKKYVDFYKISTDDILVISDDLDIELGKYKLKAKGTSGGHNGLKNIEDSINTVEYKRLKIGIANSKNINAADYVLGSFSKSESDIIDKVTDTAVMILEEYLMNDFVVLMNKYNGTNI